MACNQKIIHRYNSYTTRKIPYIKILIGIKIVELSKQLLSIAYRGKKRIKYQPALPKELIEELGKVKV